MRRVAENFPLKFIILDTTISFVYEQSQVNKFQLVVDGTPFDYLVAEMRSDVISISNSLESYLDPQSARSKSQILILAHFSLVDRSCQAIVAAGL